MKKIILILGALLITSSVYASELTTCTSKALGAPIHDGYMVESGNYSSIMTGTTKDDAMLVYIFRLLKKEGEDKKVAAVSTDLNCNILDVVYYDVIK